ncbi:MAG: hypothetical protein DHS20C11_19880 [Lysobacteraceae bacterium]|nr:MAG: hypothetical protein DHS20C11_19880 [Xanthomonadaceae bacterium]
MASFKKQYSLNSLVSLYTVVVGVALSLAVVTLVGDNLADTKLYSVALFFAFLVTLLPFCHGALRHVEETYENTAKAPKYLVFDFLLLFIHALLFVLLAQLLANPGQYVWMFIWVLIIDSIWSVIAPSSPSKDGKFSVQHRWGIVNFLTFSILIASALVTEVSFFVPARDPEKVAGVVVIVSIVRTAIDYLWCRKYYFEFFEEDSEPGQPQDKEA